MIVLLVAWPLAIVGLVALLHYIRPSKSPSEQAEDDLEQLRAISKPR